MDGIARFIRTTRERLQIGAAYTAKAVCSSVHIAGRDPREVLENDVHAAGNSLLRFYSADVYGPTRNVRASFLGLLGRGRAIAHGELGCAVAPEHYASRAQRASAPSREPPNPALWPEGDRVETGRLPEVEALLDDSRLTGPGMRGLVVVKDGRVVAERYAGGFSAATPQLGWSMTKTVNAAILGTVVKAGKLSLEQKDLFPEWRTDARNQISVADLMAMSSGLTFNEDYGSVSDVTRMLYLEPNMAKFAASMALGGAVGETFRYSSGTSVMLSRIWQNAIGDAEAAAKWPRRALFEPIGMKSAVFEADASGTFVGSSYIYATPRDWARFAQLLLQDGSWNGRQVLPPGFATMMHTPARASNGAYGQGQMWLSGPGHDLAYDRAMGVPPDTYWLVGHDGQMVAVVPSKKLVIVRMGLTPDKLGYRPQELVARLARQL